ncbi:hypothetical protein LZK80_11485 [Rhizobium leguminosarum]|nr:hypothetical protein LZK80_11485 [Rhizobium leguminosarum]
MPSLFRGLSAAVWRERFEAAGWPKEAADHMVLWLTIERKTRHLSGRKFSPK